MVRGARPRRAPGICAAVLGFALVLGAREAHAGDPAAARELLKRGYLLAQDGKCDAAVPLFDESLKLDVKAITLINYADCEEKLGRLGSALGHWVDARARAKVEGNRDVEAEAERRAKLLEPRLARLTVVLPADAPAGTTVTRDGVALGSVSLGIEAPVDPGAHTIVVHAPGRDDTSTQVTLGEGETKRIDLLLGAPARTAPSRDGSVARDADVRRPSPLLWIGFGVGAAGVAVGTITGLMALSRARDAERTCPLGNCPDQAALDSVDQGRTFGTISTVGFVVGGAGIALGATMLLVGGSRSGGASTALRVGPTGAALTGAF